jgi:G3E family GTPase
LPVLILTGFLGSGKTTLLNRLLAQEPRAAVLINEFGSVPLDQQLIERENIPLLTLAGGCLCCQVRGAFAPVLKNLWMAWRRRATPPFARVIIEASGVASPEPILDTLLRDRWLASRYRLESIVATLALPAAAEQLDRFAEARAQVAWADALVLSHADLAGPKDSDRLECRLQRIAPATPRFSAMGGDFDIEALRRSRELGTHDRWTSEETDLPDHGFRSLSLYLDQSLAWPRWRTLLEGMLIRYPQLMRIKGIVHLPNQTDPVVVHAAAGHLYPPASLPNRKCEDPRGRLVFIASGPVEPLAEELVAVIDSEAEHHAVRFH